MRQSQGLRTLLLAAAIGFGTPGAALAQLPVRGAANRTVILPAAPAAGASSNSVDCVYATMPSEDREMALLLLEREAGSEVRSHNGSLNLKVVQRLIDEARAKCSARYHWPSASADASISYAMNVLISAGISQMLEANGRTTGPIDEYYAKHRADLAGIETIAGVRADDFRAFLIELGWGKSDAPAFRLAQYYLEALGARDRSTHVFAAAVRRGATSTRFSPRPFRARTTKRGRR